MFDLTPTKRKTETALPPMGRVGRDMEGYPPPVSENPPPPCGDRLPPHGQFWPSEPNPVAEDGRQGGPDRPMGGTHVNPLEPMGVAAETPDSDMGGTTNDPLLARVLPGLYDMPAFAAELSQRRDDRHLAARIAAGAIKQRHHAPSKAEPHPTFDLVGGGLSPEAMRALDYRTMDELWAMRDVRADAGQAQDAAWCQARLDTWLGYYEPHFQAIATEVVTLRDRLAKADAIQAGGGWPDKAKEDAAHAAAGRMWNRLAVLYDELDTWRPGLLPDPLWPDAPEGVAA